ncbi:MAG: S-layer homology domain-containing protein [Syntrophomonas sp.]
MPNLYTNLLKRILARFMIIVFMLTVVPFVSAPEAQAATITIPSGNYVIPGDGIYQLANGYSGTISISESVYAASNVTLIGSVDGNVCSSVLIEIGSRTSSLDLTIRDLKIENTAGHGININTDQTVNLFIKGTCQITASNDFTAAIHVPDGKTLVIHKTTDDEIDKLDVSSGSGCAGVGGGLEESGGNITIEGGTVTAGGGGFGAGIGGGCGVTNGGNGGTITIIGGRVIATGGENAAGIGGGYGGDRGGDGGTIVIEGGTVSAIAGASAAGIGGGVAGSLTGGNGGMITIRGGTVTASGRDGAAGIGGAYGITGGGNGGTIIIEGGMVTAAGGIYAAGIGGGCSDALVGGNGGTIAITGGTVTAGGGQGAAGIGGAFVGDGGTVEVSGSPAIIATGDTAGGAEHTGKGTGGSSSGTLKDSSGDDLSYLRFHVVDGAGADLPGATATVTQDTGSYDYVTNNSGLTGCMVLSNSTATYKVQKTGYSTHIGGLTPDQKNIDVPVNMDSGYTVGYCGNGNTSGSVPADSNRYEPNAPVTVPDNTGSLVRNGYAFAGWNTVADGSGTHYSIGGTFTIGNANLILYAQWTMITHGGSSPSSPVNSSTGSASISPSQSGIVSLGSEASIRIPPGALQGNSAVNLSITSVGSPPASPSGFMFMGQVYEFQVGSAASYTFNTPVTLTFTFDPSRIMPGQVPCIYYYDKTAGQWVSLGGTVSGNTIAVNVDHCTMFAVLAKEIVSNATGSKASFKDIEKHWAKESIEKLAGSGAITGYPDNTFKPDAPITRAEFVIILVKALNLKASSSQSFNDTGMHWARDSISVTAVLGITRGYAGNYFKPDDPITREQMAVMAAKAVNMAAASGETSFSDNEKISSWAKDSVWAAIKGGIMKGYPENTFRPQDNATRAEAVSVILSL